MLMSLKSLHFEQYDGESTQNCYFMRYDVWLRNVNPTLELKLTIFG